MDDKVTTNLKKILADGKKSTFSLTSLFDSKTLNNVDQVVDDYKETFKEKNKKEIDLDYKSNKIENFSKLENTKKENFFFNDNDSRFETVKFFDLKKRENFINDWIKHKDLLIQALAKRRKLLKKKTANENKKYITKNDKKYDKKNKKMKRDNGNESKDNQT